MDITTIKIDSRKLLCGRKHKKGLNLRAICDDKRRFIYIDIHIPGTCSDFHAFETYEFRSKLDEDGFLVEAMVLIDDNVYVECKYTATPVKDARLGFEDDYNFYHTHAELSLNVHL